MFQVCQALEVLCKIFSQHSQSTLLDVIHKHGSLPSILFEDLHEANWTPQGKIQFGGHVHKGLIF